MIILISESQYNIIRESSKVGMEELAVTAHSDERFIQRVEETNALKTDEVSNLRRFYNKLIDYQWKYDLTSSYNAPTIACRLLRLKQDVEIDGVVGRDFWAIIRRRKIITIMLSPQEKTEKEIAMSKKVDKVFFTVNDCLAYLDERQRQYLAQQQTQTNSPY